MLKFASAAAAAFVLCAPGAAFAKACPTEGGRYTMIDAPGVTGRFRVVGQGLVFEVSDQGRAYSVPVGRGGPGGRGPALYQFTQHLVALENVYRPRDQVAPDYVFIPELRALSGGRQSPNMFRMTSCQR